ncbi:hypothetical protein [Nevskia soli]|uniref:hypothetical protein n=1 Tax=Nevskia soli TaxID=418856 RepID=UPI00068A2AF4|nr:hypothetical protein [Nevskia soli]
MNNCETELRPELGRGERLLWSGMPRQGLRFRQSDIFMVPFSLMWGGFAFFWEGAVTTKGAPFFFSLWGMPFVLIGIYIIVGRFFVDSYLRARTYYGVTDQRVIILGGLMNREVKSISLQGLNEMLLTERGDRSGTITFGPTGPMAAAWAGTAWPGTSKKLSPAFDLVEEVRRVYNIIRDAQSRVSNSRGS